jgi:spore coat-associated protein N
VTVKHLTRMKAGRAFLSLAVLALLAVALQSLVFSDASYTAGSSNPGSVFTAGSLSHTNSMANQVVLDASYLRPGLSKQGTLTITGGGTLTGAYTLSKAGLVDTPASPGLSNTLTLTIQDVTTGATTLYTGTVAAFSSCSLGSIAPGATRIFRFTVLYPAAGADSALDGATMALRLTFTGVTP